MTITSPEFLAAQAAVQIQLGRDLRAQNANTVDSALGNRTIANGAVPTPKVYGCPVKNIATQGEPKIIAPGLQQVSRISATSAAAEDPTAFTTGDTTFVSVPVTVKHIVFRGHLSAPELNLGLSPDQVLPSLTRDADRSALALARVICTAGNFGAADVSVTPTNFAVASITTMKVACTSLEQTLLVNTVALGSIAASLQLGADGIYRYPGVDGGVYEINEAWGDAHSVLAGPEAFTFVNEMPPQQGQRWNEVQVSEIILPTSQLKAWNFRWYDRGSRARWQTVELLFGIAPANVAALSFAATP